VPTTISRHVGRSDAITGMPAAMYSNSLFERIASMWFGWGWKRATPTLAANSSRMTPEKGIHGTHSTLSVIEARRARSGCLK
jgi:hypothetical protein